MNNIFSQIEAIIVKVTNRCNLDCAYCYEDVSKLGQDMPIEVFKKLIDNVVAGSIKQSILLIFHGGEPTLVPNAWYEEAFDYCKIVGRRYAKSFRYSMQTNLLALSDSKLEFFVKHGIQLGVSLDDYEQLNTNLRGKEDRVLVNLSKLKNASIQFGILTVINSSNFLKFYEICNYFGQLGLRSFKANPVYPVGQAFNSINEDSVIHEAQRQIIDYLIDTKGLALIEENVSVALERYFTRKRKESLCNDAKCGAGSKVIGINIKGDIYPCGRFQWHDKNFVLGNFNHLGNFDQKLEQFHSSHSENWMDCGNCEASLICSYGCQAFISRSKNHQNIECEPTKALFQLIKQKEDQLSSVWSNIVKTRSNALVFRIKTADGIKEYKI